MTENKYQSLMEPGNKNSPLPIKVLKEVSLICTVYNEADNIAEFLKHVYSQTVYPGELVIVDGGSTDGTREIISNYLASHPSEIDVRFLLDDSCNLGGTTSPIAKGRNIAIRKAVGKIIACTDAGCRMDQKWMEEITAPFRADDTVDVVGGWYLSDARSYFEKCAAVMFLLPPDSVNASSFIPSARSLAFKKTVWANIGGFPEISYTAEDTAFVINLRKNGHKIVYAPRALVYWRMQESLHKFTRLIYRYGYGDGFTSIQFINVIKNLFKMAVLAILVILSLFVSYYFILMLVIFLWILPFNKRFREAFSSGSIKMLPVLIFLRISADLTYVAGYCCGKVRSYFARK